ncbi:MAG: phosphate ABC transporter permease PstA [Alcanivoracaceae bacterium]|jgi:phosphate transport system permease protein|nr:phosphate ABC transporter permease PstA [Alcanivoracaceae bacterium]
MSNSTEQVRRSLKARYRAEKRFRAYGISAVAFGLLAVLVLFTDIINKGLPAFTETYIDLPIHWDITELGIDDVRDPEQLNYADYDALIKAALRERFPDVEDRLDRRALYQMVSSGAGYSLRKRLEENPDLIGTIETISVVADDDVDIFIKSSESEREGRRLDNRAKAWALDLEANGEIRRKWNASLFTAGDSREPEQAGVWAAVTGSFFTMLVTLALAFPIGVAAAVYLEEFAPKNRFTDFIEVNINNLAAVPSIIFGLLGLAIFINLFGLPRSVPLVGGLVLALMTLPTIIISSRAAIKSVPPSIREAALGMGASRMQMVMHHVLPLALPGMLTGAIIGMAQALGETAPLLMIGMVAFIVDIPGGPLDASTVLPVQIYLWADSPEASFVAMTSAAIMVLLAFLISMNTLAVLLRKRLERRW